jgi:AraC-like DNA-binding protein
MTVMTTDRTDGSIDARVHAPYKIALLVRTGHEDGLDADALLAGTELEPAELDNPDTRTSTRQFVLACRNALALGASPALPFRMGTQVRLSSYGLYGYAMLTSATVRDAFRFSVRYHGLTTSTWRMSMHESNGEAVWTFRDRLGLDVDDALYRFLCELQMSAHKSLAKDLWDQPPPRTLAHARYRRPPHAELYDEWLGHGVEFGQAENQLRFEAAALDAPMPMHHPLTEAMVRDMCDRLLEEAHTASGGLARHVYEMLAVQPGRYRDMTELARALNTSPRTLRRHLRAEGTSYQRILDDVRCNLAKHYLQDTRMTSEDIATALGFSDSANFRHAFHKWASQSPSEFRRKAARAVT